MEHWVKFLSFFLVCDVCWRFGVTKMFGSKEPDLDSTGS